MGVCSYKVSTHSIKYNSAIEALMLVIHIWSVHTVYYKLIDLIWAVRTKDLAHTIKCLDYGKTNLSNW